MENLEKHPDVAGSGVTVASDTSDIFLKRVVAVMVDYVVMVVLGIIGGLLLVNVSPGLDELGFAGAPIGYLILTTGLTGQTLGKKMFRLRVVNRAGSAPGVLRASVREIFSSKIVFPAGFVLTGSFGFQRASIAGC